MTSDIWHQNKVVIPHPSSNYYNLTSWLEYMWQYDIRFDTAVWNKWFQGSSIDHHRDSYWSCG